MKAVRVGILKCINAVRSKCIMAIAECIDIALPYQFLSNQLVGCSVRDGQFQCPTCRRAIEERLRDGRVTVHGVVHRIAKHEAYNDWRVTYDEMYRAIKQDLLTSINRQVAVCARRNGLEGRYHMVLRKGKELGLKLANKVATVILPAALVVGGLAVYHVADVSGHMEDYRAHEAALYEDTRVIPTASGDDMCCNRCNYTVFDDSFTVFPEGYANGHEVIINPDVTSSQKYVRTCSLR